MLWNRIWILVNYSHDYQEKIGVSQGWSLPQSGWNLISVYFMIVSAHLCAFLSMYIVFSKMFKNYKSEIESYGSLNKGWKFKKTVKATIKKRVITVYSRDWFCTIMKQLTDKYFDSLLPSSFFIYTYIYTYIACKITGAWLGVFLRKILWVNLPWCKCLFTFRKVMFF